MVYSWEEFPRATIANGLTIGIHRRRFVETSTLFSIFQRFRSSSSIPRSHDSTLNSFLRKLFRATTKVYSFVNCGFSRFQSRSGERYWMNSSLQISMNSINSTRCAPALPSLSLSSLSLVFSLALHKRCKPELCLILIYLEPTIKDASPFRARDLRKIVFIKKPPAYVWKLASV